MLQSNRSNLIQVTANVINVEVNAVLVRCLNLCQLTLQGVISDSEKLELSQLNVVPDSNDRIAYDKFAYVNKLVKQAAEVMNVTSNIQEMILAVDTSSAASVQEFQVKAALAGSFIKTGKHFELFLASNFTTEAKLAATAKKAAKTEAPKNAPKTQAASDTASATSTDLVSHEAGVTNGNNEADSALVMAALVDTIANGDIIGQTLAKAKALPMAEAMLLMAEAWAADRAAMVAEMAELQAKYVMATAPKKRGPKKAA